LAGTTRPIFGSNSERGVATRLVSFALKRYRSIEESEKLPLGDLTVLVGPNNEGKSNILRGLVTALQMVSVGAHWRFLGGRSFRQARELRIGRYDWDSDFPIELQEDQPDGQSEFVLEFDLGAQERDDFKKSIGSYLSGHLKVKLSLGSKGSMKFDVMI